MVDPYPESVTPYLSLITRHALPVTDGRTLCWWVSAGEHLHVSAIPSGDEVRREIANDYLQSRLQRLHRYQAQVRTRSGWVDPNPGCDDEWVLLSAPLRRTECSNLAPLPSRGELSRVSNPPLGTQTPEVSKLGLCA